MKKPVFSESDAQVRASLEQKVTRAGILEFFRRIKALQGLSLAKSNEYSTYVTHLFFNDTESVRAKRFQDWNFM